MVAETELYPPVKAYLETQGYTVKAEVSSADIVAVRGEEPPVVVELKTRFSLALFHQGVERLALTDAVYLAVPRGQGRAFGAALKANTKLARRLGMGLMTVRLKDGFVEVHVDPGPYAPRKSSTKRGRLLREFARREGDPNLGGMRGKVMTAYRQDACRVAGFLREHGPTKASQVAADTGVARARAIMASDHYGWFERVQRGVYGLTPRGRAETDS